MALGDVNDLIVVETDDALLILPKDNDQSIKKSMKNSITSTNSFHLIIFTNSPGEISSWVLPVVTQFKKCAKTAFITILLTPCDYATGNEYQLLLNHDAIDEVYQPKDTKKFLFLSNA